MGLNKATIIITRKLDMHLQWRKEVSPNFQLKYEWRQRKEETENINRNY